MRARWSLSPARVGRHDEPGCSWGRKPRSHVPRSLTARRARCDVERTASNPGSVSARKLHANQEMGGSSFPEDVAVPGLPRRPPRRRLRQGLHHRGRRRHRNDLQRTPRNRPRRPRPRQTAPNRSPDPRPPPPPRPPPQPGVSLRLGGRPRHLQTNTTHPRRGLSRFVLGLLILSDPRTPRPTHAGDHRTCMTGRLRRTSAAKIRVTCGDPSVAIPRSPQNARPASRCSMLASARSIRANRGYRD